MPICPCPLFSWLSVQFVSMLEEYAMKHHHEVRVLICALTILPAVALGIVAMIYSGIFPLLWGQQAAAWAVLALLTWLLCRTAMRVSAEILSILLLIFLAVTLLGQEAGGARRWINLVVFHVNAAHLVLPALIVMSYSLNKPWMVLLSAALILSLQPDLSQLTALFAAEIPVLLRQKKKQMWMCFLILGALLIRCAKAPIALEAEPYCEGILTMLGDISYPLQVIGWAALMIVPLCGLIQFYTKRKAQALSIAMYYTVSLLFTLTGEYPVLFMGFGLSPIAGYYLAYACRSMSEKKYTA